MLTALVLFIFGAMMGSFIVASVWRLRAEQLLEQKNSSDPDYQVLIEKNHLAKGKASQDHSRCLHCSYRLRFYDLIPILSWLSLAGKCRKCRKPIGVLEFLSELCLGLTFGLSYLFWPFGYSLEALILLGIWLMFLSLASLLFIYDLKWMELPSSLLYVLIILALLFASFRHLFVSDFSGEIFGAYAVSIAILAGIYWLMSTLSRERLVGAGDAYIGLALALVLFDWRLSALALFLANLIGTVLALPSLLKKERTLSARLPLGPLLFLGALISFFFGQNILQFLGLI